MSERERKVGKAAIQAAKQMLETLPDDKERIVGREVLSGKEIKRKFVEDDDFAAETVVQILELKLDTLVRKKDDEE